MEKSVVEGMSIDSEFYCLQKADFIAADLTKTAPRAQVLDFTEPFMETPLTVLAKVGIE